MEWLADFGPIGLALSAFLAATILPISSELVLTSLLLAGGNPTTLIIIATIGNVAGSTVNYGLGRWGSKWLLNHKLHLSTKQIEKADQYFDRYGSWSLLFAWLPIIGDPLTFVAGLFKVRIWLFLILVSIGKGGRYWLLSVAILQ